jgi:hypothetical protein
VNGEQSWLFGVPPKVGYDMADVSGRASYVPFVVSFGAGVNSSAVLIGLAEQRIRPDLISFADTGGEKPETYAHLDAMRSWCLRVGFPDITVVRTVGVTTGDTSLEDACVRLEILPSRAYGLPSCAHRWKLEPQERYLRQWPMFQACRAAGEKAFRALGYHADEDRGSDIHDDDLCRYVYPLKEWGWGQDDCEQALRRAGIPVPVKSACFFCPSSTKQEVLWLSERHPDLFQRALHLERVAIDSGKLTTVRGLGRKWTWASLVTASSAQRGDLSLFPDVPVESCTHCSDGGCDGTQADARLLEAPEVSQ